MTTEIQWDYCPIPHNQRHAVYRGWHIHDWGHFICFYSAEGDATKNELEELLKRIIDNAEALGSKISGRLSPGVLSHEWRYAQNKVCTLKERHDGQQFNCCLEIYGTTTDDRIATLDAITDALYEQAGLRKFEIKEG